MRGSQFLASKSPNPYICIFSHLTSVPLCAYALRLLNPSYSGACCNVRRSSDNTTMDIPFANGLININTLLNFVGSGNGYIDTWYNQGTLGSAGSVLQATTTSQPQIVSSGNIITWNGKPTLQFNSSYLVTSGNVQVINTTTGAWSGNAVLDMTSTTSGAVICVFRSPLETAIFIGNNASPILAACEWNTSGTQFTAVASGTPNVITSINNGSTLTVYSNGSNPVSTTITGTPITTYSEQLSVGAGTYGGFPITAYLSETMVVNTNWSTTDRQTLETNQGSFYNVSGVV